MKSNLDPVYVSLGQNIPNYLIDAIKRHNSIFPDKVPTIIVSKNIKRLGLKLGNCHIFEYESELETENILRNLSHDKKFRNGFWRYTLERIFALEQFHRVNQDRKLIHIEGDVLLFPNFPWQTFEKINKLSWGGFSKSHDVAALLFSPSSDRTSRLATFIRTLAKEFTDITDMTALFKFREKYPEEVIVLPSWAKKLQKEKLFIDEDLKALSLENSKRDVFDGIFDPQALGMWLAGIDPRNNYGVTRIHSEEIFDNGISIVNPIEERFSIDNHGNMYFEISKEKLPIFNLHVHSKNRKLFSKQWVFEITRLVELANNRKTLIREFNLHVLISLLNTNYRNGTLAPYLYNHPLIKTTISRIKNRIRNSTK